MAESPTGLQVQDYAPVFRSCTLANLGTVTQIRSFKGSSGTAWQDDALIVNNVTLETSVVHQKTLADCQDVASQDTDASTNYSKALALVTSENMNALQDAGATHELNHKNDIYLTVDLCPSHRPLDAELFQQIQGGVKPVPVAISISGYWLLDHVADFKLLLRLQEQGDIQITWVNHTYTHPYDPKAPLAHNFVLESGIDLNKEVFENEKLLLKWGVVPSVFFRFPGLVSDKSDVEIIRQWGLIPLGANAWLALGEKPQVGSFILVHGNGNEPFGLQLLYSDMNQDPDMKKMFTGINQAFE